MTNKVKADVTSIESLCSRARHDCVSEKVNWSVKKVNKSFQMPRCVAVFCGNTAASGHGMFTFPKEPDLNRLWRENMKRVKSPREPNKLWENTVYSRLCGLHFEENCFVVSHAMAKNLLFKPGKLQLKQDAVPTLFQRQPNEQIAKPKPRGAFEKRRRKEVSKMFLTVKISTIVAHTF